MNYYTKIVIDWFDKHHKDGWEIELLKDVGKEKFPYALEVEMRKETYKTGTLSDLQNELMQTVHEDINWKKIANDIYENWEMSQEG